MANLKLDYLKCERVASGGDVDQTYAEIFVDGEKHRWPQAGHLNMVAGSEVIINWHYEFRRNIIVKLWEYGSGSGNAFIGLFELVSGVIGSEYVFIHNLGEGDRYHLHYTYVPAKRINNSRLLNTNCVKVATGFDSGVWDDVRWRDAKAAGPSSEHHFPGV